MSRVRIAPIVEGHGEVQAVPMLIRRIAAEVDPVLMTAIEPPIRAPANRLRKPGELERTVEFECPAIGRMLKPLTSLHLPNGSICRPQDGQIHSTNVIGKS